MSRAKKFFSAASEQAELAKKAEAVRLKAIEDAKPKSWEVSPWTGLDALLVMSLAEKFHPGTSFNEVMCGKPKKFLDIAYSLAGRVSQEVLETTVLPVMRARKPFEELTTRASVYQSLLAATDDFCGKKCHGLLIHNSVIYPVKVFAEDEEAVSWGFKNQPTLRKMVALNAMNMLEIDDIQCYVLLFAQWGFDNYMEKLNLARPIGGTIKTKDSTVQAITGE